MAASRHFPTWIEALIVLGFLIMAVVESNHEQWFWACIFAAAGILFGAGLCKRLVSGGPRAGK